MEEAGANSTVSGEDMLNQTNGAPQSSVEPEGPLKIQLEMLWDFLLGKMLEFLQEKQ